ncbi:MFS transporter [Kitasatospora sp. NPDC048540]|uniref:MFS transporter n=1 Tax=unclassified Kitasatospora TaxID=2633591 RepID=UPI00068AF5D6|nr:MFS transporter [Kitasatospora sp. MBT63]
MKLGSLVLDSSPLRRNKGFRHLFVGRLVSVVGSSITTVGTAVQVYAITGSALAVGLISIAGGFPMVAGMLYGGTLADGADRRKVLLWTQVPLALFSVGLALNAGAAHPQLWLIYLLTMVQGGLTGLGAPARTAMIPELVGPALYSSAVALTSTLNTTAGLVGPALAGLLIAKVDLAAAFWIDAATFGVYVLTLFALPAQRPGEGSSRPGWRALAEGLRYVRDNKAVGSVLMIDMSAMVFGMPKALFPSLGTGLFHGGSVAVGLLYAAPGAGALIGAAASGWTGKVRRPGPIVLWAVCVWGAAIALFGLARSLPLALALLVVAGIADVVSEILRGTLLQLLTPDGMRGRLSGLWLAQTNGAPALGNAEAGAVAAAAGEAVSIVSGGLLCIVGALLIAWRMPALRHAELPHVEAAQEKVATA